MYVRENPSLSDKVCVYHRQYVSVTNSLCLSQKVFFCHRQSVLVTDILCLPLNFFLLLSVRFFIKHSSWSSLAWLFLICTWFSSSFVREISVCPGFKSHHSKLCLKPARDGKGQGITSHDSVCALCVCDLLGWGKARLLHHKQGTTAILGCKG